MATKGEPQDAKSAKQPSALKSLISGGVGGICLVFTGHPLDLIKVRMQTASTHRSLWETTASIIKKDGLRGLYRGMLAPLIGVTPIFALCFLGYDYGQRIARSVSGNHTGDLRMWDTAFAGAFSALPTALLLVPGERIKVLLQVQDAHHHQKYKGPVDVIKSLYKTGGIASIYRGFNVAILRDSTGSAAYFVTYEFMKKEISQGTGKLDPLAVITAGGLAGIANWIVCIPADTIKSRLQSAPDGTYKNMMDCLDQLLKKEGPKALFKGLGPAVIRAFPANAACFFGVEMSKSVLDSLW